MTGESLAIQDDLAVLPHIEPQAPLINGEPRHQPVLVNHMRAQKAEAIGGGEDMVGLWGHLIMELKMTESEMNMSRLNIS